MIRQRLLPGEINEILSIVNCDRANDITVKYDYAKKDNQNGTTTCIFHYGRVGNDLKFRSSWEFKGELITSFEIIIEDIKWCAFNPKDELLEVLQRITTQGKCNRGPSDSCRYWSGIS